MVFSTLLSKLKNVCENCPAQHLSHFHPQQCKTHVAILVDWQVKCKVYECIHFTFQLFMVKDAFTFSKN